MLKKSIIRLKYEELFFLQLGMNRQKLNTRKKSKGYVFKEVGDNFNKFFKDYLPFELTNAQKRVVKEIRKDLGLGSHMNRLLQGDVGSGKTIVSLLSAFNTINSGFQVAFMAPTTLLAEQHFINLQSYFPDYKESIALLTGSTKAKEKAKIKNVYRISLNKVRGH